MRSCKVAVSSHTALKDHKAGWLRKTDSVHAHVPLVKVGSGLLENRFL